MRTLEDVVSASDTCKLLSRRQGDFEYLLNNHSLSIRDLDNLLSRCELRHIARPLFQRLALALVEQAIAGDKAKLLAMGIETP